MGITQRTMRGWGAAAWPRLALALALVMSGLAALASPVAVTAQTDSFTRPTPIDIPNVGPAPLYPSTITVGGLTGVVSRVQVTLTDLSHTWPDDIDVLLVGPTGRSVILMSDAGGSFDVSGVSLTFDDAALATLPTSQITSGTFQPTNYGDFDDFPAPAPVPTPANPYGSTLSVFAGTNPNGDWSLYVVDDAGADIGRIDDGWSLTIETDTVQLSAASYSVDEDAGSITVSVTRTGAGASPVSVQYATAGGSASPGSDYGAVSGTLSWGGGDSDPKTFTIPIIDDTAVEGSETINLLLSGPTGGAGLSAPSSAVLTIDDNESSLSFSSAAYSAPESGGVAQITVNRNGGTRGAICVSYAASGGTATPADYGATAGQLCWDDGDGTPKFFQVPLVADGLTEAAETVNLALSAPTGGAVLGSPSTAVLTILDFANAGAISIPASGNASPYPSQISVAGLAGSVTRVAVNLFGLSHTRPDDLDVLLAGPTGQRVLLMSDVGGSDDLVAVNLTFADGATALPGGGPIVAGTYAPTNAGAAADTFPSVPAGPYSTSLADFNGLNPNGTWSLYVVDDSGGNLGSIAGGWSLTIDTPGALQLSAATYSAGESDGSTTVSVTRVGGSTGVVSVQYATADDTATAGADYTAASGTLTWAAGDIAPKTFTVALSGDTLPEPDEVIDLSLSATTGGATLGTPSQGALTIIDDEISGSFQLSASAYTVDEDAGVASVLVERVGGDDGAVCVSYSTSDGTATEGDDYGATAGQLCWADGNSVPQTFDVAIIDNTTVAANKSLNLTLSSPTGQSQLGVPSTATLTIVENDVALRFGAAAFRAAEADGAATIALERVGGSRGAVCVGYSTSDGTAIAPGDYTASGGTVCWADGDVAPKTFTVPVIADALTEGSETVSLSLSGPTGGATIGSPGAAALTILDFASTTATRINTSGPADPYPSQISVAGLAGSVTRVTVSLYGLSHTWPADLDVLLVGPTGQRVLLMSDVGGALDVAGVDLTFADGGPALPDSSQIVAGTYAPTNSSVGDSFPSVPAGPYSTSLADFNGLNPNGTWSLYVFDDEAPDSGALAGWGLAIDTPGALQLSADAYTVDEDGGSATVTVERVGGSTGAVSVQYATSDGTAAGADYSAASGTLTWAAGDISPKTFAVPITDDVLADPGETIALTLSGPTGGAALGSRTTGTLTINDDDTPGQLQLSAAAYSALEGDGTAVITVTRVGGVGNAVSVTCATSNGTATAPADYTATSAPLSWAAGEGGDKTCAVPLVEDTAVEGSETVNLTLSGPTGGATLGAPVAAVLTIEDNDSTGQLQFSAAAFSVGEAGGQATIIARRVGGSSGPVSVSFATSNGTATAPADYTARAGTLSWADGDSADKTFTVPVINDGLTEANETVTLTLSDPVGGATLGSPSTATLTIQDNDTQPAVQFSAVTFSVREAAAVATITVARVGSTDGSISVGYTTADGTATAPDEYGSASGTLFWAAGDGSAKTFTVPIEDDFLDEGNKTVLLILRNPTGGAVLGTPSSATLVITDDDPEAAPSPRVWLPLIIS